METWTLILAGALLVVIAIVIVIYYVLGNRRKEVEAVEVDRPERRTREITPFDEDMEEALYKKRVVCPDCGEDVYTHRLNPDLSCRAGS